MTSIRRVLNATGIILHTNLGRAPLGGAAARRLAEAAQGYSNLEYDLCRRQRGSRQSHLKSLLREITGAEEALVVNNNAAAVFLVTAALAKNREVVVARGELIEIGDSFRIPEILAESGARLREVGATNRAVVGDYADAITPDTAILMKIHTSNFRITGETESVPAADLARLANQRGLLMVHDLGSGMLRRPAGLALAHEPTVVEALAEGADLVTFSGDKLLGGPQAGIIAGKRDLVARLGRMPAMRMLRPGKLTLAALEAAAAAYTDDARLCQDNPVFRLLARTPGDLRKMADRLLRLLADKSVAATAVESPGQIGGGALPGEMLPGWAVEIAPPAGTRKQAELYAERAFAALHDHDPAVLGILREGKLLLDLRALAEDELPLVAAALENIAHKLQAEDYGK